MSLMALTAEKDKPEWANVGMLGQVYVKVSLENGEIKAGDPITTSSSPGIAMKASQSGRILGSALQPWNGTQVRDNDAPQQALPDSVGMVLAIVQPTWFEINSSLDFTDATLNGILSYPNSTINGLIPEIKAERAEFNNLTISSTNQEKLFTIDSSGNAFLKGTLTAGAIKICI